MTITRRPLVAGNWKMNGLSPAPLAELGGMAAGYDAGFDGRGLIL